MNTCEVFEAFRSMKYSDVPVSSLVSAREFIWFCIQQIYQKTAWQLSEGIHKPAQWKNKLHVGKQIHSVCKMYCTKLVHWVRFNARNWYIFAVTRTSFGSTPGSVIVWSRLADLFSAGHQLNMKSDLHMWKNKQGPGWRMVTTEVKH